MVGVSLALLLFAGAAGCGGDEDTSDLRLGDIDAEQPFEIEIRDMMLERQPGEFDPSADILVDPSLFATIEVLNLVYGNADLRHGIVEHALDNWERTEILLGGDDPETNGPGGQELDADAIAAIQADLEAGADDLPVDTFLKLPAIVRLYERSLSRLESLDS